MKIAVATIFYNDVKGLYRLWNSLVNNTGYPDYWFCIDGKFDLLDSPDNLSTDGSREFIQDIQNTNIVNVKLQDFIGTEHDKREKYLDLCREYKVDALIILDSDEFLQLVDWNKLRDLIPRLNQNVNLQCILCDFNNDKDNTFGWYPRLWLRPYEMSYWNAHCIFKNNITGIITRSTAVKNKEEIQEVIRICGDDTLRDKEWLVKTFHYQEKMIQREKVFRKTIF